MRREVFWKILPQGVKKAPSIVYYFNIICIFAAVKE